jgi:GT2 family glycosyltransferase
LAHEFGIDGEGYDLAVSTEMLEHDPFWQRSLRRMIEVTAPGGGVVVTCAGPGRPAHEVGCAPETTDDGPEGHTPYYRGLGLVELLEAVRVAGADFEVVWGEEHSAPSDSYLALVGRTTTDDGRKPTDQRPLVSVVTPCVGNVALTRQCLESLWAYTAGRWELVLVENGSRPENRELLGGLALAGNQVWGHAPERVVFLSFDRMLGYPAAVNRGIRAARGDYVCLLNNDTELRTPGWDTLLIETLEGQGGAIVSPVTDFIANPAQLGAWEDGGPAREADVLFFVCVLMRRELFDQAGLLDEDFGLGNGEDREFCGRVKARLAGRLLVDPGVFVHHEGHGTFRRLPAGMFGELLRRNEALAQSKAEKRAGGS